MPVAAENGQIRRKGMLAPPMKTPSAPITKYDQARPRVRPTTSAPPRPAERCHRRDAMPLAIGIVARLSGTDHPRNHGMSPRPNHADRAKIDKDAMRLTTSMTMADILAAVFQFSLADAANEPRVAAT
jgi:hypothetical protein